MSAPVLYGPDGQRVHGRVEKRDPRAAVSHVSYTTMNRPMLQEWDAGSAIARAFYANVFVYRCVQVRAQALAGLPLRVGADPDKPNDFNPKAPLLQFLKANPEMTWRTLAAFALTQYDVTGRWAWELEMDSSGRLVAPWVLIASNLDPVASERGRSYFTRFEYRNATWPAKIARLPAERVFYAWRPAQHDPRQAESLLQAQRLNVSVAVMQERYNYAFLVNDSRPSALVVTQEFADEEDFLAFKEQFTSTHGGPDNAGKPVFLEVEGDENGGVAGLVDIRPLGLSQKDSKALELLREEIRAICMGFGVPLSILGDSSDRTFSNAGQENENFWAGTMAGHVLPEFLDHVNLRLAPRFGDDVAWFDLSKVAALRPKSLFQPVTAVDAWDARIATMNEAREAIGLPARPDGDELKAEVAPPPALPPPPPAGSPPDEEPGTSAEDERTREPERNVPALGSRHASPEDLEARRARVWRSTDAAARAMETTWQAAMVTLFERQERGVVERLKGRRGRQMLQRVHDGEQRQPLSGEVFDPVYWSGETESATIGLYRAVAGLGVARIVDTFPGDVNPLQTAVEDFIRAQAHGLADRMTTTTAKAIAEALAEGVSSGEGITELAARVSAIFGGYQATRAETIARTEVLPAYNATASLAAHALDPTIVGGQEWVATRDARTREEHAEADGQVVPMGTSFVVGGVAMRYPGDHGAPAHLFVRCRCTVAFLTPAEMAERVHLFERRWVAVETLEQLASRIALGELSVGKALGELVAA